MKAVFRTLSVIKCVLISLFIFQPSFAAVPNSEVKEPTVRDQWREKGVEYSATLKSEIGRNMAGGDSGGTSQLNHLDLKLSLDAAKLKGWKNTSFFVHAIFDQGSESGKVQSIYIGDGQGTSNIETAIDTFKLFEAWVQHTYLDNKASILFGLHDLSSEFYVTESSLTLLNQSFGVGRELSATGGKNGPSIFPKTSPTLRYRYEVPQDYYFQVAAFQSKSNDLVNLRDTQFSFDSSDGLLLIAEAAKLHTLGERVGKYAVGVWTYTTSFDKVTGAGKGDSAGLYVLAEEPLSEVLSVFFRYGLTMPVTSNYSSNTSAGFLLKNTFNRPNDSVAFGVTSIVSGSDFFETYQPKPSNQEITYEISYRWAVRPWLILQPDYQYVSTPIFSRSGYAQLGMLRLEASY